MTKKELREKRGGLWEQMKAINGKAETEKRDPTKEEMEQWDKLDVELKALTKQIEMVERQEALDKEMEVRLETQQIDTPEKLQAKERAAFRDFLTYHPDRGMKPETRAFLEKRTDQTTTAGVGGYLIPEGFMAQLEKAMLDYLPVFPFATVIRTSTGNDLPWPMMNDTSNKGELLGEASNYNAQALAFTNKVLKAYKFTSKVVTVSYELLQDAALPIEQIVADALAERIGRVLNQYFTTGTGSSEPQGCIYGATANSTHVLTAGVTRSNILTLIHSVDPAYRRNGMLMMQDAVLKSIKLLTVGSSDDRPLWVPSMRDGEPDKIEGYPYIVNPEMATYGAGNIIMGFGDFKKFIIRIAKDVTLIRLNELYALNMCVGFISHMRADSAILNAGTNPIKTLHCGTT